MEGRDGFLFLTHDTNEAMRQHAGERLLSARELDVWRALLEHRVQRAEQLGGRHHLAIAPDTHSVYPHNLPAGATHVEHRPVRQLIEHLARTESSADVFYPLEELVARGAGRDLCLRTDSHWTDFGAFLFYRLLMERVGADVPVRVVDEDDLEFDELLVSGDLGTQLEPTRFERHMVAHVVRPAAKAAYDNCVSGNGSVIVTRCDEAPDTTCLLFGDSYAYALLKFLPESFRRLVFVHRPATVPEVLDAERPDVVISLIAERFIVRIPVDEIPGQLRALESEKRGMGRTRMPMTAFGMTRSYASVGRVEEMRALMTERSGSVRDATIVSLMAYAALDVTQVHELRWSDVGGMTLWDVVREDLERLRDESAGAADGLAFADIGDWAEWRTERFAPVTAAVGLPGMAPWSLRNTYVHLRLAEGTTPAQLSAELGLPPGEVGYPYDALAAGVEPRLASGEEVILAAREAMRR